MPFAQGANTRLTVAEETSFGVLPTSPSFTILPYKTHSLDMTKARVTGADITGDRMARVDRHGHRTVSGDIEVDLRRGDYDLLLESAFFSTFNTSDEITIGATPKFLTFEDAALDITQFRQFSGCLVSSATFNIAPDQMVQTTFGIVGRDVTQAQVSLDATPTAESIHDPFDSFNGELLEGGVGTANDLCTVSALTLSITNEVTPANVILCADNRDLAAQMNFGMATVEGTITLYYEDATIIDKFINETESELSVTVDDPTGANGYTFYLPRIKYNSASVPVANMQGRLIEVSFTALKDPSSTLLRLTRTSGT